MVMGHMMSPMIHLVLAMLPAAAPWPAARQPGLAGLAAKARELTVEPLGAPIRTSRMGRLLYCPNGDGRTYDLLQIYFPEYGGPNTIVIMDLATGEVKQVLVPREPVRYQFHLCPAVVAPNGKLYISVLSSRLRQKVCLYDPARNELKVDCLPIPDELLGETHPMKLGTNGRIYCGGQHPGKAAAACEIDPATDKVTFYGPIGPSHAPSGCWGYSVAADDRHIYIASGKVPWYLVAFDRRTHKSAVLAETQRVGGYVSVGQGRFGCTARVTGPVGAPGKRVEYWLHEGRAIPKKGRGEKPPWPEPQDAGPLVKLPPRPEVSTAAAVPDRQGRAEIWYRTPDAKAEAPKDPPAGAPPESLGWKVVRFRVPTYPQEIHRITELPDGRIFGTAGSYEGCFTYDPKTRKSEHLGKFNLSHYATAVHDGKVYMSGYPGSPVYVYDPSRPWTALKRTGRTKVLDEADARSNPRRVTRLKAAGTHKMYSAAVGADGKVYFGGRWYRNGSGGGLGWWDPKARRAGGVWREFSNYQINFIAAVDGGRTIAVSAHRVTDTVLRKPKPEQGAVFFFDVAAGGIAGKCEPVAKAKGPGPIVAAGPGRILGWTEDPADPKASILYGVDVASRKVAFRKVIPFALPVGIGSNQRERWDFRLGPDGCVWTFLPGSVLVRIDPKDAKVHVAGRISPAGRLAFSGEHVYLSGATELRRLRRPR